MGREYAHTHTQASMYIIRPPYGIIPGTSMCRSVSYVVQLYNSRNMLVLVLAPSRGGGWVGSGEARMSGSTSALLLSPHKLLPLPPFLPSSDHFHTRPTYARRPYGQPQTISPVSQCNPALPLNPSFVSYQGRWVGGSLHSDHFPL